MRGVERADCAGVRPDAHDLSGPRPQDPWQSGGMDASDLPPYSELVLPTVQAVSDLGGSATSREITDQVLEIVRPSEEMLAVGYKKRPDASVFLERLAWARSYAKLIGSLESPKR